jgi:hypothetical protein
MAADSVPDKPTDTVSDVAQAAVDASQQEAPAQNSLSASQDRTHLVDQARAFLRSPQVANEDLTSKRSFLLGKGLTVEETERVIAELVSVFNYMFMFGSDN